MNSIPFFDHRPMHGRIAHELKQAFESVLGSDMIMLGKEVTGFEKRAAEFLDCRFAIGVNSGLDAMIMALEALQIGPGDEVIVPSNTYVATWIAVSAVGAIPVPVEPNPEDHNINPDLISSHITSKTKAIIPVHLFGKPCNMEEIMKIAHNYGLWVIEDNAQAFGSICHGSKTGSIGHINAHSFYPTKNLGAIGDAGLITTNDESLFEKCQMLRNYGFRQRYAAEVVGHNSRMDELQAAILNVKIMYVMDWIKEKQRAAKLYIDHLYEIPGLTLPHWTEDHTFHLTVIQTEERDALKSFLEKNNVLTVVHYPLPPHKQKVYSSYSNFDLPIAQKLAATSLSLPNYIGLGEKNILKIAQLISDFFNSR